MKTRVAATSIAAYRSLHDLSERQREVHEMLRIRDMSNMELHKALGWSINRITGRTKELREAGLVELKYHKLCPYTGHLVKVWGLKEPAQRGLFMAQEGEKHAG